MNLSDSLLVLLAEATAEHDRLLSYVEWHPATTAPVDGTEFHGLLNNGWRLVLNAGPDILAGRPNAWWRTVGSRVVPYLPSYGEVPADAGALRLVAWLPLPPPPEKLP